MTPQKAQQAAKKAGIPLATMFALFGIWTTLDSRLDDITLRIVKMETRIELQREIMADAVEVGPERVAASAVPPPSVRLAPENFERVVSERFEAAQMVLKE